MRPALKTKAPSDFDGARCYGVTLADRLREERPELGAVSLARAVGLRGFGPPVALQGEAAADGLRADGEVRQEIRHRSGAGRLERFPVGRGPQVAVRVVREPVRRERVGGDAGGSLGEQLQGFRRGGHERHKQRDESRRDDGALSGSELDFLHGGEVCGSRLLGGDGGIRRRCDESRHCESPMLGSLRNVDCGAVLHAALCKGWSLRA